MSATALSIVDANTVSTSSTAEVASSQREELLIMQVGDFWVFGLCGIPNSVNVARNSGPGFDSWCGNCR